MKRYKYRCIMTAYGEWAIIELSGTDRECSIARSSREFPSDALVDAVAKMGWMAADIAYAIGASYQSFYSIDNLEDTTERLARDASQYFESKQ